MANSKHFFFLVSFSTIFVLALMAVAFAIAPVKVSVDQLDEQKKPEEVEAGSLFVAFEEGHCGYVNFDEDGLPTGYAVSVLSQIGLRMGASVEYQVLPYDEAFQMLYDGFIDILVSDRFIPEQNRNDEILLTSAVFSDAYVLIGKNVKASLDEVANKRIAVVDNQFETISYPIYSIFYDTTVYQNIESAVEGFACNEYDYLFGRYSTLYNHIPEFEDLGCSVCFNIQPCSWGMGFSKKKPELKKKIDSIIFHMSADRSLAKIEGTQIKSLIGMQAFYEKQPVDYWISALIMFALFLAALVVCIIFYFREKKQFSVVFDILSEDDDAVFLVDTKTDSLKVLRMNAFYMDHFSFDDEEYNFFERVKDLIIRNVYKDDKEYVSRAFNKETIIKELQKTSVYYVSYRIVFENKTMNYQCKITRAPGTTFRNFIVAIRNLNFDANIDTIRESQIPLVNVLLYDFEDVSYADLDTGNVSHYRFSELFETRIPSWQNMLSYKSRINYIADNLLFEGDRLYFLEETKKENVLQHLKNNPVHSIDFRLMIDEEIVYYQLRYILISQNSNSVVLGFRNIDTFKRRELEQKRNLEVIEILASEYESVFYANLAMDSYVAYRVAPELYNSYMNVYKKIVPYNQTWNFFVDKYVYKDDQDLMRNFGDISTLLRELKDKPSVSEIYRSNLNGYLEYFSVKVVKIDEDDSDFSKVVIGLKNCDIEVRKEREKQQQLEKAMIAAEAANKAKTTFLFNMSHDIRTPMNAILGFTAMAKRNSGDVKKTDECLEKVEIAGKYLLELIDDILDMSRIENGKTTVDLVSANIFNFSNEMIEIIKERADEQGIKFTAEYKDIKNPDVFADVLHTNQILLNILSNAVKYTKSGGSVHFTVQQIEAYSEDEARFRFTVSDTGIGMSADFVEHIFEAFSREQSTTLSGIKGTGLGMAITKKLIELLGGEISVESKVGKGTVVTVELSYQIIYDTLAVEEVEEEEVLDGTVLIGKRVLLVEDNELNREIAIDMLETEGMVVESAVDGLEAVEKVFASADNLYDFVLMDVQMPRMDGYTATKTIRNSNDRRVANIPIIAMTANAFEEDRQKALESGMNAHLPKPVDVKRLINTLTRFVL